MLKKSNIESSGIWTKNYTIMTIGSFISYMGNLTVSFILGVLVLDISNSVFLYGLYRAVYYLSKVVVPIFSGPFLDKVSRKKVIYVLDFFSAGIYLFISFLLKNANIAYSVIFALAILIGCVDCTYNVAFGSLYPTLVKKNQLQKAYSIHSMLDITAGIAVPVAVVLYEFVGLRVTFLIAAILFFCAAVFETLPKLDESHVKNCADDGSNMKSFKMLKEGFTYIRSKKAIFLLSVLVMFQRLLVSANSTLLLPFCRSKWDNGFLWYIIISSGNTSGYFMGGLINSRFKIPPQRRTGISTIAYIIIAIVLGTYLFLPRILMLPLLYLEGICLSTVYTLRTSAIQREVDNNHKGRYAGIEAAMNNIGILLANLLGGVLGEVITIPTILCGAGIILLGATLFIFLPNRKCLKQLYENDKVIKID